MNPEDELRNALQQRADQVEPAADSYARLAQKVDDARDVRTPWWQSPRLLWLSAAAGGVAALLVVALIAASGDGSDDDEVATVDPTPATTAEPAPAGSPTPAGTPLPTVSNLPPTVWPLTAPDGTWPTSAEDAVLRFHEEVLGIQNVPLAELEPRAGAGVRQILSLTRGIDGQAGVAPDDEMTNFVLVEVAPGQWGIADAISSHVDVFAPEMGAVVDLRSFTLTGLARPVDGRASFGVLDSAGAVVDRGSIDIVPGTAGDFEVSLDNSDAPTEGAAAIFVTANPVADNTVPAVRLIGVTAAGAAPEPPSEPASPVGQPADVIWPTAATQPFGEWHEDPGVAAREFVTSLTGYELPIGEVVLTDPVGLVAEVSLQSFGEDGEPFGEAILVRLRGGLESEGGREQWGVVSAASERIRIDGWNFIDQPPSFEPQGSGWAFEGTIGVQVLAETGGLRGDWFVMGGGVELVPLTGSVPMQPGPAQRGYAIFSDLGGLGIAPTALTIVAVDIPQVSESAEPLEGPCSADGLDPLEPDTDIPEAVEATRQAIGDLARACDFDGLASLTSPDTFFYSFGGGDDPAGFWRSVEAAGEEPMRFLVELLRLPAAEDGTAGALFFIWPPLQAVPWEDVTEAERDMLRPLYDDEDFAFFDDFGGYIGYRLAIDEDGVWRDFVAGD